MRDPFLLLGLSRGASADEIKYAFRHMAMRWHPDRNPTREAEDRFKEIKAAYELLLDAERLAEWESSPRPDADCEMDPPAEGEAELPEGAALSLHLKLEEAASGCTRTLTLATESKCVECHGRGSIQHLNSIACASCKGIGCIRVERKSITCVMCGGRGFLRVSPCVPCGGSGWIRGERQIHVRVPAGMRPGERLRLARQYRPREGSPAADLFVSLVFQPHPLFALDGNDLHCSVPVSIFRLLHGGGFDIPTLSGMREIQLETYPGHGLDYSFAGLGYPGRHGRGAGHLRLHLEPVFPRQLSEAERKLLLRLDKTMRNDPGAKAPELDAWEEKLRRHGVRDAT
jgi:molecular chaperone DnaJ